MLLIKIKAIGVNSLFACAAICLPVHALGEPGETESNQDSLFDLSLGELTEFRIITGSNLKKKSYNDAGSPIDVLSREKLEADALSGRLVDVLKYLPYNSGNHSGLTPGGDGGPQEGRLGAGTVDLRGLGGGATLVLLNGQRHASFPLSLDGRVDVNALTPTIMLDRIEVLKDGASAVYGSDAVSGVMNVITRKGFEGFEFHLDGRGTYGATQDAFDHNNYTASLLFGSPNSEDISLVAGLEYFKQDNLTYAEVSQVPVFNNRGASSFGNPGSYVIPKRDENGLLTGESMTVADPDCQAVVDANINQDPNFSQTATSLDEEANLCRITFPNQPFLLGEERWISRVELDWTISDNVKYTGALGFAHVEAYDVFNATTPVLNLPTVPGEHPANPFVATDANGNQLFALDENADGIPDRDSNGEVILDENGIAFNEDVLFRGRPYSATNYGLITPAQELDTFRIESGLTGDISSWTWNLDWNMSRQQLIRRGPDSVFSEFQAALNGNGGPNADLYFNPFGSSLLGTSFSNDPSLQERIGVILLDKHVTNSSSLSGVITGNLLSLPAGDMAVAVGAQSHRETLSQDFDQLKTIEQVSFFGNGDQDFKASQNITAVFAELNAPLFDSQAGKLDLSLAGRLEKNDGETTFNPKLSIHYSNDYLSLTSSYATSFLSPSLFQSGGITAQFANVEDPVTETGEQVSTRITGNPELEDQESTSYSYGATFKPNDQLSFELTYWRFEFENLIAASLAQAIVDEDPNGPLIERNSSGIITLIRRPFFNAGSINTDGIDYSVNYSYSSSGMGDFKAGVAGTLVNSYEVQESPNGPIIDGVGSDNNGNIGSAIAKSRANAYVNWSNKSHSVDLIGRYYSDVERTRDQDTGVAEALSSFDLSYKYVFENTLIDNANVELRLGARNIFNSEPSIVLTNDNQYFIGTFQDPAGRILFANLKIKI